MLVFLLSLLLLTPSVEGENPTRPKYFVRIDDGEPIMKSIGHSGEGTYVKLVPYSQAGTEKDTLKVYIQGVVKGEQAPDIEAAKKADLAVWCYPSHFSYEDHMFPNSGGRIFIHENPNNNLVTFMMEDFAEKVGVDVKPIIP